LSRWLPKLGPTVLGESWQAEPFAVPSAVRLSVPVDADAAATRTPVVSGSLRHWQAANGRDTGFPPDAAVDVKPFAAQKLHEIVSQLAVGVPGGRPGLHSQRASDLRTETNSDQLRHHLTEALSDDGYQVVLDGPILSTVTIKVDLHHRELVRVMTNGSLTKTASSTHRQDNTVRQEQGADIALSKDITLLEKKSDHHSTEPVATTSTHLDASADTTKYLVRAIVSAEVIPSYRGRNIPDAWTAPMRTGADGPVWIEVNRAGLEALGLRAPDDAQASGPQQPHTPTSSDEPPVAGPSHRPTGSDQAPIPQFLVTSPDDTTSPGTPPMADQDSAGLLDESGPPSFPQDPDDWSASQHAMWSNRLTAATEDLTDDQPSDRPSSAADTAGSRSSTPDSADDAWLEHQRAMLDRGRKLVFDTTPAVEPAGSSDGESVSDEDASGSDGETPILHGRIGPQRLMTIDTSRDPMFAQVNHLDTGGNHRGWSPTHRPGDRWVSRVPRRRVCGGGRFAAAGGWVGVTRSRHQYRHGAG
jgi:hypothetical protein